MDSEDLATRIDHTYKNLLEKFNPTARQLISAGKAYLKSLQNTAASSKVYLDVLSKLASESQQSPTGASNDIGRSLAQVVDVYKEVQTHQNNILKAFYVDFILPLETNLEKDSKVLQTEHKKYSSNQKIRKDALLKAENNVRKQRKKKSTTKSAAEKEIKSCRRFEEERANMDGFLDQFHQNATDEERRRYKFILERLCSLGRHHLSLHGKGAALLQKHLNEWSDVCGLQIQIQTEDAPQSSVRMNEVEDIYSTPAEEQSISSRSPMRRRAQSLDGFLDDEEERLSAYNDSYCHFHSKLPLTPMSKAMSELNIDQSFLKQGSVSNQSKRSLLMADNGRCARASFSFNTTTENQLGLEEGDVVNLIGEKSKGWQFGQNQRTRQIGWFPVAYTEKIQDEEDSALGFSHSESHYGNKINKQDPLTPERTSRGQSLDRLDKSSRKDDKIRARSVSSDVPRCIAQSNNVIASVLPKERVPNVRERPQTSQICLSPQPPPSTDCESETKKTFETYDSHLFISSDMEEDLQSYEGSYRQAHHAHSDKLTSFRDDYSVSPSLCRSFTSPELPACFRKSISSKDSIQCSDDSGFSNEDNANPSQRIKRSGDSNLSKSPSPSWVTDSFATCEECNSQVRKLKIQNPNAEKNSPVFLNYLYPNKNYASVNPYSTSVEGLDDLKLKKRENWIINTFGTFGRKKKNIVSPCAQKIATQKARRKKQRVSLRRSSSLLCIDMTSCGRSVNDPIYASNYDVISYAPWHHQPIITVPQESLPAPPPFEPPPLPDRCSSLKTQQYIQQQNILKSQQEQVTPTVESLMTKVHDSSSSGNSSWSESTCLEAYMVVQDHSREIKNKQGCTTKRSLNRSKTWGAPDAKKSANKFFKSPRRIKSRESEPKTVTPSYPASPPPKPLEKCESKSINKLKKMHPEDEAPPLPPRRKCTPTKVPKNEVNILNYSQYMVARLANPEGSCRFDQRSFTTGQKCSAWYDLWEDNKCRGNLV